ncbi:carboxylating nicotinate-nucleotide diphosphorylase [Herbiconiux flava]|uniref:Nicotinate-nucleotide pyrophosphorylase [carboxylating] n=1 Tax=Herbiconiux flava TaxID=881268 RepID=A0A852SAP8_9MICO|nr:carboxylating nicotinate-nucleotide diphosphorylase [Herbiconiux flava]NYD69452.1 nicotinate-nucleotide pyrophosphorylase (carboxylating) [Herbiconiux flava]GLK16197.1 nicotinate-nucleotide diphosphorylase (carboxylating) [Herbiconiux flava]
MLTTQIIDDVVARALAEDAPWGDLTSELLIPEEAWASARLEAREPGVFSGGAVWEATMRLVDPRIRSTLLVEDGERFEPGAVLATVEGPARGILRAERVGLNLVQRMSAIATETSRYVAAVAGTGARIVDTRKTTPGLRALERAAVRAGGGHNHRFSLSDAVLAKDNHLAVLAQQHGGDVTAAIRAVRAQISHTTHLEVEVDRLDQIEPVLAGGVDTILLDNFTLDELRAGVALVAGRALVDASGGVTLDTVGAIARTGVDLISVGALTHSVRALDLGLDIGLPDARSAAPAAAPALATEGTSSPAAPPAARP